MVKERWKDVSFYSENVFLEAFCNISEILFRLPIVFSKRIESFLERSLGKDFSFRALNRVKSLKERGMRKVYFP